MKKDIRDSIVMNKPNTSSTSIKSTKRLWRKILASCLYILITFTLGSVFYAVILVHQELWLQVVMVLLFVIAESLFFLVSNADPGYVVEQYKTTLNEEAIRTLEEWRQQSAESSIVEGGDFKSDDEEEIRSRKMYTNARSATNPRMENEVFKESENDLTKGQPYTERPTVKIANNPEKLQRTMEPQTLKQNLKIFHNEDIKIEQDKDKGKENEKEKEKEKEIHVSIEQSSIALEEQRFFTSKNNGAIKINLNNLVDKFIADQANSEANVTLEYNVGFYSQREALPHYPDNMENGNVNVNVDEKKITEGELKPSHMKRESISKQSMRTAITKEPGDKQDIQSRLSYDRKYPSNENGNKKQNKQGETNNNKKYIISLNNPPQETKNANQLRQNESMSEDLGGIFCMECLVDIPLRGRHCKSCEMCIATFDHHCGWIGNCVGERNKKYFILFLFIHSLVMAFGIMISLFNFEKSQNASDWLKANGLILVNTVFMTLFLTFVLSLLVFQIQIALVNQSTWENYSWHKIQYMRKLSGSQKSPFNQNCIKNWEYIFCNHRFLARTELYTATNLKEIANQGGGGSKPARYIDWNYMINNK